MDTTESESIAQEILADALTAAETLHPRLAQPQDPQDPDRLVAVLAISQGDIAQALRTSTSEVMMALKYHDHGGTHWNAEGDPVPRATFTTVPASPNPAEMVEVHVTQPPIPQNCMAQASIELRTLPAHHPISI